MTVKSLYGTEKTFCISYTSVRIIYTFNLHKYRDLANTESVVRSPGPFSAKSELAACYSGNARPIITLGSYQGLGSRNDRTFRTDSNIIDHTTLTLFAMDLKAINIITYVVNLTMTYKFFNYMQASPTYFVELAENLYCIYWKSAQTTCLIQCKDSYSSILIQEAMRCIGARRGVQKAVGVFSYLCRLHIKVSN